MQVNETHKMHARHLKTHTKLEK